MNPPPRLFHWLAMACAGALPVTVSAQTSITQAEPDDSIPTHNVTGITAASTGWFRATGNNGDGVFGGVAGNADTDFFKLTAGAGQVIQLDLKNASDNGDFDSAVGILDATGALVAANDDAVAGNRGSRLTYAVVTAGEYYVCVGNGIDGAANDAGNFPSNPQTPGTVPNSPRGTPGPYVLYIGMSPTLPVAEFDGSRGGNPRPAIAYTKFPGTNSYSGKLRVRNTGFSGLSITAASLTGVDAPKFAIEGPVMPAIVAPGSFVEFTVYFDSGGSNTLANAAIDFTGNDPFDQSFALKARGGLLEGGGQFDVRELQTGSSIANWSRAGEIINGNTPSTETTATPAVINYSGGTTQGFFSNDAPFPAPGEGFVTMARGQLKVTQAGDYTFRGYSDDGQRLFVNDLPVGAEYTDYSVAHFYTVNLAAGDHTISFQHFEGGGGDHMELSVAQELGTFTASGQTTWELLESYGAGNSPAGPFEITAVSVKVDGSVDLTWSSAAGRTYTVQASPDMTSWSLARGGISSGGTTTTTNLPGPFVPGKRFFRVKY